MEGLLSLLDAENLRAILSDAATNDFSRLLFLFTAAAFVHGKQVRKEIRGQFGLLIDVLREDLEAQKSVLGKLTIRVDDIEQLLRRKIE